MTKWKEIKQDGGSGDGVTAAERQWKREEGLSQKALMRNSLLGRRSH
jgi:hypothetical protein